MSENFLFGITSPAFNNPADPAYNPNLAPYDLSRNGWLFQFSTRDAGSMYSGFAQDNIQWGRLRLALGFRYDKYRFLRSGKPVAAAHPPLVPDQGNRHGSAGVLEPTFQTPPNENLLLSNSLEAAKLAPPLAQATLGGWLQGQR